MISWLYRSEEKGICIYIQVIVIFKLGGWHSYCSTPKSSTTRSCQSLRGEGVFQYDRPSAVICHFTVITPMVCVHIFQVR